VETFGLLLNSPIRCLCISYLSIKLAVGSHENGQLAICVLAPFRGVDHLSGRVQVLGSRTPTLKSLHEPSRAAVKLFPFREGELGSIIASNTTARSYGVLVMGPAESKLGDIGTIPSWATSPMVGLIVYRPARPAGDTREPSVSVPIEMGA
jgi:hypothetical protein